MAAGVSTVVTVSMACWYALEVVLMVRDLVRRKGRLRRDRGTRTVVSLTLAAAIVFGILVKQWLPALDVPVPVAFVALGVAVIWAGLAIRIWAVVTLGGSFRTSVEVDDDQPVVTVGPYRWVRHPAYTGLVLIVLGFGIGVGNWLSLVICAVVPVLGLLPRIAVEESEMTRVLGDAYRDYRTRTDRLIPRLW